MMLSQIWEAKNNFLTTCFAKPIYYILTQLPQKQSYGNKEDTLMKLILTPTSEEMKLKEDTFRTQPVTQVTTQNTRAFFILNPEHVQGPPETKKFRELKYSTSALESGRV
jgi:hypothetical protein